MAVSLLNEIAVKAKWDGSFTEEWTTIRSFLSREGCLEGVPGASYIQKLAVWAQGQGLLMDFDVESVDFSSHIRTVTFWSYGELPPARDAGPSGSAL